MCAKQVSPCRSHDVSIGLSRGPSFFANFKILCCCSCQAVKPLLQESGIPVPTHIIVDREGLPAGQQDPEGFKEDEDFVELGGIQVSRVLPAS